MQCSLCTAGWGHERWSWWWRRRRRRRRRLDDRSWRGGIFQARLARREHMRSVATRWRTQEHLQSAQEPWEKLEGARACTWSCTDPPPCSRAAIVAVARNLAPVAERRRGGPMRCRRRCSLVGARLMCHAEARAPVDMCPGAAQKIEQWFEQCSVVSAELAQSLPHFCVPGSAGVS